MRFFRHIACSLTIGASLLVAGFALAQPSASLTPLLKDGQPVSWWFMFKLNASIFPNCTARVVCPFGGTHKTGDTYGLQFVYASSDNSNLVQGSGCAGESVNDPLGATYNEIYNGNFNYVVWNDQFYDNPHLDCAGSDGNCLKPWGHSKGMVAWDDNGNGLVLQVTTPDWPGAGNAASPRPSMPGAKGDGNTLGCVGDDNVIFSQHFFALQLTKDDVAKVLRALANASVVTNSSIGQIVDAGHGPADLKALVDQLGQLSNSVTPSEETLSSNVILISKPSSLHVAPWQLVSSLLGGVPLRAATWWGNPSAIPTTTTSSKPSCWSTALAIPGPVEIATSGEWAGKSFGLTEGPKPDANHAKIGVSTAAATPYVIFGDMNQQGALIGNCAASQNARGGLFFVMKDATLRQDVAQLISGTSAPTHVAAATHKAKKSTRGPAKKKPARKKRAKRKARMSRSD